MLASDVVDAFLRTYVKNVHPAVILGDIRDRKVRGQIIDDAMAATNTTRDSSRLAVLGGPPCQGFSTAGKRRSSDDERNHLFRDYLDVLDALKPDLFVFENVTGLLNMQGGAFYEMIVEELRERCDLLEEWVLHTHEYGIPQRRSRVILVGHHVDLPVSAPAKRTTAPVAGGELARRRWVSVTEALSDLPPLEASEDGSAAGYRARKPSNYQRLMRGLENPSDYLAGLDVPH